ncbi:hypothetical protein [Negadavirga shengliensis]|uniref:SatD family (SatD) n=1 Tax=Negadavirga shengliensis TaxID=1389218 RepID=A0ABV9T6I4_9BACT
MIAVITGDIVQSQKLPPDRWLESLKNVLAKWGTQPADWEIYRGDSFQLKVNDPRMALKVALHIKAAIKKIPPLDVRMAIGIGEPAYIAPRISESNGGAFVRSGETFERLEKMGQHLLIGSPWPEFDRQINLMLKLALTIMDHWTAKSAKTVSLVFENPGLSQTALGELEGINQNTISTRLKRSQLEVIEELMDFYTEKLNALL